MPTPKIRKGNACFEQVSYSKSHGAAPEGCDITIPGLASARRGDAVEFLADASHWGGKIVDVQTCVDNQSGYTTRVRAVDFRDLLFDKTVFARINMIDDRTGEVYSEFNNAQFPNTITESDGKVPAWQIIGSLAQVSGFKVVYSAAAAARIKAEAQTDWSTSRFNTYNLDWTCGIKVGPALDQIAELLGLQFTIIFDGTYHLRFTLKGVAEYGDLHWSGAMSIQSEIGAALQPDVDTGVWIVGERDLYEFQGVALNPAWNQEWNKYALKDGLLIDDLRAAAAANPDRLYGNPLVDLVEDFLPDDGIFAYRKPLNKMTIHEYISKVPFRLYRIAGMENLLTADEFTGVKPTRLPRIAAGLATEPGRDYRMFCHGVDRRSKVIAVPLQTTEDYILLEDGYRVQTDTGLVEFNEPRILVTPEARAANKVQLEVEDVIPDAPYMDVCVVGQIVRQFYGTNERVGSKQVSGLRHYYVVPDPGDPLNPDPTDPLYRDPSNPKERLRLTYTDYDGPSPAVDAGQNIVAAVTPTAVEFVLEGEKPANELAVDIANAYLSRQRVITSGSEKFFGSAGHEPSGEIQRVTVSISNQGGIEETVSYANDEPSPAYEPQIELRRKIALDRSARNLETVRRQIETNETTRALIRADKAGADPLGQSKNILVHSALEAFTRDGFMKVAAQEQYQGGEPVVATSDGSTVSAVGKGLIDAADPRMVGVAVVKANGTLDVVHSGVAHARVKGPVDPGDTLDVSAGGSTFESGAGQATAIGSIPDNSIGLIPIRLASSASSASAGSVHLGVIRKTSSPGKQSVYLVDVYGKSIASLYEAPTSEAVNAFQIPVVDYYFPGEVVGLIQTPTGLLLTKFYNTAVSLKAKVGDLCVRLSAFGSGGSDNTQIIVPGGGLTGNMSNTVGDYRTFIDLSNNNTAVANYWVDCSGIMCLCTTFRASMIPVRNLGYLISAPIRLAVDGLNEFSAGVATDGLTSCPVIFHNSFSIAWGGGSIAPDSVSYGMTGVVATVGNPALDQIFSDGVQSAGGVFYQLYATGNLGSVPYFSTYYNHSGGLLHQSLSQVTIFAKSNFVISGPCTLLGHTGDVGTGSVSIA